MKQKTIWALMILLFLVIVFTMLAVIGMDMAYKYRSDPSEIIAYDTDNFHIGDKTYVSAHRSGAGIMPEETMLAFKKCVDTKDFEIDYFEFDLRITKDNVLVLLHDEELDRTSDCVEVFGVEHVRAEDYTFEELRKLNMGAQFVNESGEMPYKMFSGNSVPDDLRILDIDTVLDYLEDKGDYRYIIEIKNEGELGKKGVDILYKALKDRGMLDRAVFGTFQKEVSEYKDEKYPDFMRGAYPDEVRDFYIASLLDSENFNPKYGVLQLPFNNPDEDHHLNFGTAKVLNYAHKHNLAVQYWTVNDIDDIAYLMEVGADCIMSDYPDRAWRIREAFSQEKEI